MVLLTLHQLDYDSDDFNRETHQEGVNTPFSEGIKLKEKSKSLTLGSYILLILFFVNSGS